MSRKTLLITLFVSLALNLFAAGALVGGLVIAARRPPPVAAPAARPGPALWAAGATLPPPERRAYHEILRSEAPQMGEKLREARKARREAWDRMKQEPFDAPGAEQDLDRAMQLEIQARRRVERRLVEFARRLPPEERARFAEGLGPWAQGQGLAARRRMMREAAGREPVEPPPPEAPSPEAPSPAPAPAPAEAPPEG